MKKHLLFTILLISGICHAQINSIKSGDFNDPTVWSTGVIPGTLNDIQIVSGHMVTVTATDTVCVYHVQSGATLVINSNVVLLVNNNGCSNTAPGLSAANKFNNLGTITGGGCLTVRGTTAADLVVSNNGTMDIDSVVLENYSTTSYDVNFQNGNAGSANYQVAVTALYVFTGDDSYFYNYSTVNSNVFITQQLNTAWDSYVTIENKSGGSFTANAVFLNNSNATQGLSFFDNYGTVILGGISTSTSVATIPYFKNESSATFNYTGASIGAGVRLDPGYAGSTVCYCSVSQQQTIAVPQYGTSGTVSYYENLTLNNQAGSYPQLIMPNAIQVNNTLNMIFGIVNMSSFTFTLGNNTPTTGTLIRTSGHFYNGTFKRHYSVGDNVNLGTNAGLFPLGTSYNNAQTFYRPLWFGALSLSGGSMSVSHVFVYSPATAWTNFTDMTFGAGTVIQGVSTSYWNVSRTWTSAGGNKYLRYGGQGFGSASLADLDATQSNSATVGFYSAATNVNTSIEVNRILTTDLSLANSWYIGTKDITSSPLPVTFLNVQAQVSGTKVVISWKTGTEVNNDRFEIERRAGNEFEKIGEVIGAGNSNKILSYDFVDYKPGVENYYRIKQIDFDGQEKYSDIVFALIKSVGVVGVKIYDSAGRLISGQTSGMNIVQTFYADGSATSVKIIKP